MKSDKLQEALTEIDDQYIQEAHEANHHFKIPPTIKNVGLTLLCTFVLLLGLPKVLPHGAGMKDTNTYDGNTMMEQPYEAEQDNMASNDKEDASSENQVIVSSSLTLETKDLEKTMDQIDECIQTRHGFIQTSNMYNYGNLSYSLNVRIPCDEFDQFVDDIKQLGNVTYYSKSMEDVTKSYNEYSLKLESLKKEYNKLLEFYDQATTVSDLMDIEARLSDVQYEIDYYESLINSYDDQIQYSSLYIDVEQTSSYSNTETGFISRLKEAITNGLSHFGYILEEFIITLVYNIWLIGVIVLIFIGYKFYKKHKK